MISNLPDNCTQADIDRAFGGVVTCAECRREFPADSDSEESEGDWNCPRCARALARQDVENDE